MVLDPAAFPVAFNRLPAFGIRRWRQAIEYRQFKSELTCRLDLAAHLVNDGALQNAVRNMSFNIEILKKSAIKELATILYLTLFGLIILPPAIYVVGKFVFGAYGGAGVFAFYGTLLRAILDAEPVVLFLILSPYLIWQLARLTAWGFRRTS